jgi:type IV pilus modification protein PilV
MKIRIQTHSKQSGSTLIEVLITMLIGSISVLGFAALQLRAQQEHRIGFYRTLAVGYANQYLDSQRNNYRFARDGGSAYTLLPTDTTPASPGVNCFTVVCTPAQINEYDRYIVVSKMRQNLPESGISLEWIKDPGIDEDANNPSPLSAMADIPKHPILRITLIWREPEMDPTSVDTNCTRSSIFANLAGYRCTFMSTTL